MGTEEWEPDDSTLLRVFTAAKRTVGLADVRNICKTGEAAGKGVSFTDLYITDQILQAVAPLQ